MIISPLRALMATPFTSMLTKSSAITHFLQLGAARGIDDAAAAMVDHVFEFVPVVLHEALHRPRRGIPKRTDGVALNAIGDIDEKIQVLASGSAAEHAQQQAVHPARPLAARCALPAGLGHVEAGNTLE